MPQVPPALRKERASRLRLAGEAARTRLNENLVGSIQLVLVEMGRRGHAENFADVEVDIGERGKIAPFRIVTHRQGRLVGRRMGA